MVKNAFLLIFLVMLPAVANDEYQLYNKARDYWYDNNWEEAAKHYKKHMETYPDSPRRCKSENYLGYCYKNMERFDDAFNLFSQIVKRDSCSEDNLADARAMLVNLAAILIEKDPSKKQVFIKSLEDPSSQIRYMAALQLAKQGDKSGMEVFFHVVEEEKDQDLRELAVSHIYEFGSPENIERLQSILEKYKENNKGKKAKMIRLIIRNLDTGKTETKINLPIGLAQTIISMLNKDQVALIKQESGVDLTNISKIRFDNMPPGTTIFQVVDRNEKKEIKLFLE